MSENTIPMTFADQQIRGVYSYTPYKKMIAGLSDVQADIARTKAWEKDVAAGDRVDDGSSPVLGFMQDAYDVCATATEYFLNQPIDTRKFDTWLALRDMICAATRLSVVPGYTCVAYPGLNVRDMVIATAQMIDVLCRLIDKDLYRTAPPVADEKKMQSRYASIYMDIVCGRSVFWLSYVDAIGSQLASMYGTTWKSVLDEYANARFILCVANLMGRMNVDEKMGVQALSSAISACSLMFDTRQAQVAHFDCPGILGITPEVKNTYEVPGAVQEFPSINEPYFQVGNDERGYCRIAKVPPVASIISLPSTMEKRMRLAFLQMRAKSEGVA